MHIEKTGLHFLFFRFDTIERIFKSFFSIFRIWGVYYLYYFFQENKYYFDIVFLKFVVFKKINEFNYNVYLRENFSLSFLHAVQSRNPEQSTVITQLI